jgi:glycosyltransferase involved in cell wall biosynthesis
MATEAPRDDIARSELSVVIPAYNEAERIGASMRRLATYLAAHHPAAEIVVADDGSTDDTAAVVRELAGEIGLPVSVLGAATHRGKGHAVRRGMLAADGALVLMTDADFSTPIEELEKLHAAVTSGADVAIGSRRTAGAVIEKRQPAVREAMGRVFTWLTRQLLVDVSDVTCGFKLFRREAARAVFSRATLDDWSFDAEALFLVKRLGLKLVEVPVHWSDAPGTKVRLGRDAVESAVGLARILLNDTLNRYGIPSDAP